ncbi:hypothetical protein [Myxococcus hansupus]|uniref:hypothetical protein n=1 Tax=Pseudomyxococcus hansupus TaxID=1297742 RepID=UPI000272AACD|nr:hypothetical protein [Myxococcus hansupus]
MSLSRRPFAWSAAILLTFATTAVANPISSAPQALCDNSARPAPGDLGEEASAGMCFETFCDDDFHCQSACPSAQTAACVNNVCEYTYRTGGGPGGGGPGPLCHAMLCSDDYHCQCRGHQGYCGSDNVCYF